MNINNINAVLVLYNCNLKDSSTVKTLNRALVSANRNLDILVYDNSPIAQYNASKFTYKNLKCSYIHNANNPGLAEAYNTALKGFTKSGKEWLLLLDQDTHFSDDFFTVLAALEINRETIGALIPKVTSLNEEQLISPMQMRSGGIVRPIQGLKKGVLSESHITGINSGTLLSKAFLNELGGFDTNFPLDMLDHWYFRELQNRKYSIYLLNVTINQELSIHNLENGMSVDRYAKLLRSEKLFLGSNIIDKLIFRMRLIFRLKKQLCISDKSYFFATLKQIF